MKKTSFICERECTAITGLQNSTLLWLEKIKKFPKRQEISKNTYGWPADEITEWLKSRVCNLPTQYNRRTK